MKKNIFTGDTIDRDFDLKIFVRFVSRNLKLLLIIIFVPGLFSVIYQRMNKIYLGQVNFYLNHPLLDHQRYKNTIIKELNRPDEFSDLFKITNIADKCYQGYPNNLKDNLVLVSQSRSFHKAINNDIYKKTNEEFLFKPKNLSIFQRPNSNVFSIKYFDGNKNDVNFVINYFLSYNRKLISDQIKKCINNNIDYINQMQLTYDSDYKKSTNKEELEEFKVIVKSLNNQKVLMKTFRDVDQLYFLRIGNIDFEEPKSIYGLKFLILIILPLTTLSLLLVFIKEKKSGIIFELSEFERKFQNLNYLGRIINDSKLNKYSLDNVIKKQDSDGNILIKSFINDKQLEKKLISDKYLISNETDFENIKFGSNCLIVVSSGYTKSFELSEFLSKSKILNLNIVGWFFYDKEYEYN